MIRTRHGALIAGLFALLALAVEPAAAQSSLNEELIQGLNLKLLYVAIPITILVEVILVYTVVKYKDNEEPKPTQENRRLEITWTVATAIILLFVGFASYQVLGLAPIGGVTASANPTAVEPATTQDAPGAVGPPADEAENVVQVEVVAEKYLWKFNYPAETVEGNESRYVSTSSTLTIPANTTVYLHVISNDWLHAVHVPGLGLKQDAFPGNYNTITTEVYETGTYQLYCAEYCGVGHSAMLGTIEVVSQEEYRTWMNEQKTQMQQSEGNETTGGNQTAGGNQTQTPTETAGGNQTLTPTETAGGNETQTAGGNETAA